MTVAGQTAVNYSYDNANRLTQITQGSSTVSYTYDAAGRKTSLTLPNGVLVQYAYDAATRVTNSGVRLHYVDFIFSATRQSIITTP